MRDRSIVLCWKDTGRLGGSKIADETDCATIIVGGSMATLFERVGGETAVEAAVVRMYERIMADPLLAKYFASLDMRGQIDKQIAFVTMALGGPNHYSGRSLRVAHAKLDGLADVHFDAVAHHFQAVLEELGVEADAAAEALAIVAGTRADVLNR